MPSQARWALLIVTETVTFFHKYRVSVVLSYHPPMCAALPCNVNGDGSRRYKKRPSPGTRFARSELEKRRENIRTRCPFRYFAWPRNPTPLLFVAHRINKCVRAHTHVHDNVVARPAFDPPTFITPPPPPSRSNLTRARPLRVSSGESLTFRRINAPRCTPCVRH